MRRTEPETDKDFLAVKGPFTLHIMPQTSRGWRAFGWWTAAILTPAALFVVAALIVAPTPDRAWISYGAGAMLLATGLLVWLMVRWMLERATIVSPADIAAARRDRRPGDR